MSDLYRPTNGAGGNADGTNGSGTGNGIGNIGPANGFGNAPDVFY